MRRLWVALAAIGVLVVAAYIFRPRSPAVAGASIVGAVAPRTGDAAGYARADQPRALTFPSDQGPHNDYQTEWWYYTGNLTSATGERFGYQLTFFRRALSPATSVAVRGSDWATNQVYMAHFALTDAAGGQHLSFEKLARGAAGLAGAQADPFRVWLEEWSVSGEPSTGEAPYRTPPQTLRATAGKAAVDLQLGDLKGPILQGEQGYSRKGAAAGNASYYYSLTRINTRGTVTIGGREVQVTGLSWMDHEYSTSALAAQQAGWDWFSIQLDDDTEVMVFQLRRQDGSIDEFSAGTFVGTDGSAHKLGPGDFTLRPVALWRSPRSGAQYPSAWLLEIPSAGLSLRVTPLIPDQEMAVSYTYWEGAVDVTGSAGEKAVSGHGYVELTGYAGSLEGEF